MELRHHPLMSYRTICNWPPVWTCGYGIEGKTARGEIGILKHVILNERMPHTCFMIVDYAGECYVDSLLFDDAAFCEPIYDLLQGQRGQSITDIGNLDLI
jgi:hypothetical protein